MHPKHAAPDHDVHELITRRWSPRAFDPTRPVSRADLLRLFEAARWAPSSLNEQPWRFIVVPRNEASAEWKALVGALTANNQAWATAAPVLVLVALRLTLERNDMTNPHAWYDTGQAVALLVVQATSQGLSVRQMEGFDHGRAREACGVPAGFEPAVVMAIGYAGDPASLTVERHRVAETTPRGRRGVADFVFSASWGKAY